MVQERGLLESLVGWFVFDHLPRPVKTMLVCIMKWTFSWVEFHLVIKISVIVREIALLIRICSI